MPKHIAFVCLHGSAKSLMAAEYLNRRAIERGLALEASSADASPTSRSRRTSPKACAVRASTSPAASPPRRRATISRTPIASSRSAAISATT